MTTIEDDQPEAGPLATVPGALPYVAADQPIASAWGNQAADLVNLFRNPPACRAYNSAVQSIPHNTDTVVALPSELFDTDTMHDPSNGRFTIKTPGLYVVEGNVRWASSGQQETRLLRFRVNNAINIAEVLFQGPNGAIGQHLSTVWKFAVNDWVEMMVYHFTGSALNIEGNVGPGTHMAATWLGVG